ncbi:MAG: hypothetical protein FJ279_28945, partial [Planctomycetes bacterium]|nr:hypothetical protein [Planctomycetota bacterium]
FGDHPSLKAAAGIPAALQMVGWYHKDPELVWAARLAGRDSWFPMGQDYSVAAMPQPPLSHVGVTVSRLPRLCYDYVQRGSQYRATPNLPLEQTFDKLAIRGGWERADEYMLLDGFGRGNHMHFDANAIVSFAKGGEPLLVDGEYIKNSPKYHNSLVIIRNGQAEFAPAVTGLGRADQLDTTAFTRTWLTQYNGAEWTRHIVWRRNDYFLVMDEVRALEAGDYTLRCCWRPWGEASLKDGVLTVAHPPMQLAIANADGAASRLETLKVVDRLPISRLSQQVSVSLKKGEAYRFVNLVHAGPQERPREVAIQRLGEGLVAVQRKEGRDLVAFGPGVRSLPGLEAEMVLLTTSAKAGSLGGPNLFGSSPQQVGASVGPLASDHAAIGRLVVAGGKSLGDVLKAAAPVSLELAPTAGTGVLAVSTDAEVTLRLKPNSAVTCGSLSATADGTGLVALKLAAGRHALKFDAFPMYLSVTEAVSQAAKLVAPSGSQAQKGLTAPALKPGWQHAGFDPLPEVLPVASVKASAPHSGRYGPVEKIFDGECSGSTVSVMWEPGVTPVVIAELAEAQEIKSIVLREWHMNPNWDIGDRKLELSSDGFKQDVRAVPGPFANVGQQRFGGNINTLFEAKVGQKARQLRLTLTPARPECTVYLAEVELHGVRPGAITRITACATGDLNADGKPEVVIGSASGGIRALTADGKPLWTFASDDRAAINCLACADVDGDGKAEVMYGAAGRLGLVGSDGKERWRAEPPKFRGITSDVMTVFPADVNGDRKTEIVCGCAS